MKVVYRTVLIVFLSSLSIANVSDIRDLISVDDVMEDEVLQMGPNGGLIFCMEFVLHILLINVISIMFDFLIYLISFTVHSL